jgi:hypothetical protein
MRLMVNLVMLRRTKALPEALHAPAVTGVHFIRAKFRQKFRRLSVPPKSVVKLVESTKKDGWDEIVAIRESSNVDSDFAADTVQEP